MEIKSVSEYLTHLNTVEGDTLDKQEVVDVLTTLSTRKSSGQRRGQLAGLSLEEMSDEQLKREIINAKSVLYKAQQREAGVETIEKNQARVDAAMAEKAKRDAEKAPVAEASEAVNVEAPADEVYAENDEF